LAAIAAILVALVAALHAWFLVLEMFLWQRPLGMRTFHLTPDIARVTATLAANQGLYNGFLAVGLVLTFAAPSETAYLGRLFLLGCVMVAGVYGAASVSRRILFVQAVPGALALAAVLAAGRS
jgi:putative membrane protein